MAVVWVVQPVGRARLSLSFLKHTDGTIKTQDEMSLELKHYPQWLQDGMVEAGIQVSAKQPRESKEAKRPKARFEIIGNFEKCICLLFYSQCK